LRREEACQLRVRHVVETFGVWVFDLTAPGLTLKGADAGGSLRKIPIHKDFLALGFLENKVSGRNSTELLFVELSNDNAHGMYGSDFGKSFSYYLNKLKIFDKGTEVGVHQFRNTFSTQLENTTAKESFISELTGNIDENRPSERNRYTKQIFIQNLKETIDLLELPIQIPCTGTPGLRFIQPETGVKRRNRNLQRPRLHENVDPRPSKDDSAENLPTPYPARPPANAGGRHEPRDRPIRLSTPTPFRQKSLRRTLSWGDAFVQLDQITAFSRKGRFSRIRS